MQIKATPHCQHCLNDDCTIQHVISSFAEIRKSRPSGLCDRANWPPCAKNAMICTAAVAIELRNSWHRFQLSVVQLLWHWVEMTRISDLNQQLAPGAQRTANAGCLARTFKQTLHYRPVTCIVFAVEPRNKWGSTNQDFALVFSFWSKWTPKTLSRCFQSPDLDSSDSPFPKIWWCYRWLH